jgi:hypothetical protein
MIKDFLPHNIKPTTNNKRIAKILAEEVKDHRENPDIISNTSVNRSRVKLSQVSEDELKRAGFKPVVVAIPELGQTSVISYRHPKNGLHFHKHGDEWLFHEDSKSTPAMMLQKYKQEHPNATMKDLAKYTMTKVVPETSEHLVTEGGPGLIDYIVGYLKGSNGLASGSKGMSERPINFKKALVNSGVVVGASTILETLLSDKKDWVRSALGNTAAVAGLVGTHTLVNKLKTAKVLKPQPGSFANALLMAGTPTAGAVGGRLLTTTLIDELREGMKK